MQGRIKDFFSRDRKTLYIILSIVLISIFSLTIVYAALSVTLNITGNAQVVASTWDIHLDNVKVTNGSVSGNAPTITGPTTATFSTTLNMPGDFYEFTIDVVNNGSIDAMIEGVSKTPTLTTEQAKYLNYIIEYQNGESISTKQLVSKNSFVKLKVRVEFRKDIIASDLPTTSETLNLAFTVNYVQSDGTGSSVTDNGVQVVNVVNGDGTQTGDELCIGDECFFVISSTDDTVTMLAKYNLYVGGSYDDSKLTAYGDEATGKQDSNMLGWVKSGQPYNGTSAFSNSEKHGTNYSDYSGSIVEGYVNNYKTILEFEYGVDVVEARLITTEELESLGCSEASCESAPSWVYATSYWSGSDLDEDNVDTVTTDGSNDPCSYNADDLFGVRPVIIIPKDEITETENTTSGSNVTSGGSGN